MASQNLSSPRYTSEGWSSIASGVFGLLAIGGLIGYLLVRSPTPETGVLMNRLHDAAVIVQFLFLLPLVFGIRKISKNQPLFISQTTVLTGVTAICLVVISLIFLFPKVVSDILYMIPQGIFGAWLVFINLRLKAVFSGSLRWFGIIVGTGLVLVGLFPLGFAIFIDPDPLRIPPPAAKEFPQTTANNILHIILSVGSILGVLTLPVWSILSGRRFLTYNKDG